ncbi:MAG TPA: HD domain-containing phosphohydrolase [Myxococcales bacterium]|nr:HD domain-containing phosphohydrolase [Myxococcales bacterium]
MIDLREMLRLHVPLAVQAYEQPPAQQPERQPADDPEQISRDEPSTILVVDDDPAVRHVISTVLREEGYTVRAAASADQALELLRASGDVPTVLSDLKMPGHDGIWLLDQVLQRHPHAAVVMLTGYGDTENAVECLKRGAADYLLKPPRITDLVRAIERAQSRRKLSLARSRYHQGLARRVREKTAELTDALRRTADAYNSTLSALVAALDAREHETSDHSQRVVRYTLAIADKMSIRGEDLDQIGRGALLHDIGKIGVPDSILLKAGPLTPAEWVVMRKHPEIGHQILQTIGFLTQAAEIVLSHQERWDGGGYPRRLKGTEIPLGARIFAIADTLDAMTSDRPYRRGVSYDEARAEIARCSATQFDPACVEAFVSLTVQELTQLRDRRGI